MCNLNVIDVLEFISRDLIISAICNIFLLKIPTFNFYQCMRPKSGLKSPKPLSLTSRLLTIARTVRAPNKTECVLYYYIKIPLKLLIKFASSSRSNMVFLFMPEPMAE